MRVWWLGVLGVVLLFCSAVICDCPNNCYQADIHGYCNTTSNQCQCTEWWTGDDCSIAKNDQVDWDNMDCLHGGLYVPPYWTPSITRYCQCPAEWTGVDCAQCANDTACDGLTAPSGKPYICDSSLVVFTEKQFNCTPSDPLFRTFFGTGIISANCSLPPDNTGVCYFNAYTKPTGTPLMFNCTFSKCSHEFDGTDQWITCAESECKCTSQCSDIIKEYIETARTKTTFNCPVVQNLCYVTQSEIALLNESPFTCVARECRDPDGVPVYSTGGQKENEELVLAVSIGIPLLIVVVAALTIAYHSYHRRLLLRDYQDLGEFKASLSFSQIQCIIVEEATDFFPYWFGQIARLFGKADDRKHKTILHRVSGRCVPGQVTAILGPSGSGKTTLLDILAKRKTVGLISGTVLVNDAPRNLAFKRISGYVSQEDVLYDTLTVREHLEYCAQFRLPETMTKERKQEKVDEVIRDLGLKHIEHSRIGSVARRGISGGERKRVTIASELLVDPSILFLDEPTSGLDSHQAHLLVQTIVQLARNKNRTVVMAIHQPRSNIYELFDQICLLKEGKSVYFGPALKASSYFANKGHACPPNYNVPDFLLDVISMLPSADVDEFIGKEDDTKMDDLTSQDDQLSKSDGGVLLKSSAENGMDIMADTTMEYPTTPWHQTVVLTKRSMVHIIRKPQLLRVQYAMGIGIGIIMGWVFYKITNDYQGGGITNRLGALFFIGALLSFTSITSIDAFFSERLLFARERGNGSYRTSAYFFSKLITEILVQKIIPTILAAAISYYMVGFRSGSNHFGLYLLYLLEISTCAALMCLALSAASPSVAVGNILAISILFLFLLFAGFLVSLDSIPKSLRWLQYISFLKYAFEGMLVNEMHGLLLVFNLKGYPSFSMQGDVLLAQMNIDINSLYPNVFYLIAWIVWYLFWTYVFLKLFVKEHR